MNKRLLLGAAVAGIAALVLKKRQNHRKASQQHPLTDRNPDSRSRSTETPYTPVSGTGNQPWSSAPESRK